MTGLDWVLVSILAASGLLAVLRGLLSEALSVGSLVGAALCALIALPYLVELTEPALGAGLLALAVDGIVAFAILYVTFSFVAHRISEALPRDEGAIGAIDRLGGFVFGLARGGLIISALYAVLTLVQAPEDQPPWITEARLYPYVARGSDVIRAFSIQRFRDSEETFEEIERRLEERGKRPTSDDDGARPSGENALEGDG